MSTRTTIPVLALTLTLIACDNRLQLPAATVQRSNAAKVFTELYSKSRLAQWNVQAAPGGTQCDVLFIRTSILLDETRIEAMHYGAGAYDVVEGGVRHFYPERTFRGVVYKDSGGRTWNYGDVTTEEAETLTPCR